MPHGPHLSTILSAYASVSTMIMLVRTILNEIIPQPVHSYIATKLSKLLSFNSSDFTFLVERRWEAVSNETFRAVEVYLPTIACPTTSSLLVGSNDTSSAVAEPKLGIPVGAKVVDYFQGMRLEWTLECKEESNKYYHHEKRTFKLTCNKNVKDKVLASYFPHIANSAQAILKKSQSLKLYTFERGHEAWVCTIFKHPSTFDTLAMDSEIKQSIKDDLDLFATRKGFFNRVGRAWKRGYLLYGPPGTGKSSLVAAIANYMRYNIYDLQFQNVRSDSDLRNILTSTTNRSIILIEDVDCSGKVSSHRKTDNGFGDPGVSNPCLAFHYYFFVLFHVGAIACF